MRVSFRKSGWIIVLCVFLIGNAHICCADNLTLAEAFFSRPESVSGMIDVPGKGPMRYYAQNDGLWGALVYEQGDVSSSRPIRDSGCGPTATAMAIAALVPESGLRRISDYADTPYAICECSVNNARCNHRHGRYLLTSDRDYARFLPLIFADFATGNNTFGVYSRGVAMGTSSGFIKAIAAAYGLDYRYITDTRKRLPRCCPVRQSWRPHQEEAPLQIPDTMYSWRISTTKSFIFWILFAARNTKQPAEISWKSFSPALWR